MREEQFHAAIGSVKVPFPHRRFGIYRNNVASALINALRVRFPVTARIAGAREFSEIAGEFALNNLPQSPVLIGYGTELALRFEEPIASVARLENLWWHAYHAEEADAVTPDALLGIVPEELAAMTFRFHPSFGLMSSNCNAGSVWLAVRDGLEADFKDEPQYLLVARPDADVEVKLLPQASYEFIAALAGDATLADAFEGCAANHGTFDLASELAALLSHRIVVGV